MTPQVETHIKLGIRSVSPSDQSSCCPHEETLDPYLPIAKYRGVSPRNVAESLRELSRRFSAKLCRVLFFSAKKKIFRAFRSESQK